METNAGCRLPCWWGWTPGKTRWEESYSFLAKFASVKVGVSENDPSLLVAWIRFPVPEKIHPAYMSHLYLIRDGIIASIEAFPGNVSRYQLQPFLEEYGEPAEIKMRTYSTEWRGELPGHVTLFYPEQGIIGMFSADATLAGDAIKICMGTSRNMYLGLWSPEKPMSFDEATRLFRDYFEDLPYRPVEEAAGMTTQEFYHLLREPATCFRTPADLWPMQ